MTLLLFLSLGCRDELAEPREGDNPGECENGADDDADGFFDCDDNDCMGAPACQGDDPVDSGDPSEDKDGDGYSLEDGDCDDNNPDVNPGAAEICNNVDDDCNGEKDDSPVDGETYYADSDGDGYGDPSNTVEACSKPSQYSTNDEDCDDDAKDANPNGVETDWDGVDQDCDGYDVNLEACVVQSVADATEWVEYWSYSVSDRQDSVGIPYVFNAGYELQYQTLYVDSGSHQVTSVHNDATLFDVQIDSQQALNHSDNPFWFDYYTEITGNKTWYYCDGYVDWNQVPYSGDIQVSVSGTDVTAQVSLTGAYQGYVQDDVVLWNYSSGGSCGAQTLDTVLDLADSAGYGFGYDILAMFDSGFTDNQAAIADEFEKEIVWYIEYNCSQ